MKHISSSASLLSSYKSRSSLHLWNDAPIFVLVFSLARSSSFFLHCFASSVFLFLPFDMGSGGANCGTGVLLLCCLPAIVSTLSLNLSDQVRAGAAWGRGLTAVYVWAWLTLLVHTLAQTLLLALIGCVKTGAVDSCKSNYSHWVEPQTVDFYTADLDLILLSDHNHNFSKYNQNIVTDYNVKSLDIFYK